MKFKKFCIILCLLLSFNNLFAQNTPKPYSNEEFSQTSKDIRRFEIIFLGSMPFTTFDVVLVYSGIKWAKNDFSGNFPNPFTAKNSLSGDEIKGVLLTSLGLSLSIALTDFIINKVKRSTKTKQEAKNILVLPEELNPIVPESKIELPPKEAE